MSKEIDKRLRELLLTKSVKASEKPTKEEAVTE